MEALPVCSAAAERGHGCICTRSLLLRVKHKKINKKLYHLVFRAPAHFLRKPVDLNILLHVFTDLTCISSAAAEGMSWCSTLE